MSEYDSILKEKKKYQEIEKPTKKKHFPYLLFDIIVIVIILVVSYFIYYTSVLSSKNILISDITTVINNYKFIFNGLAINGVDSEYNFEGTLSLNDLEYNYNIVNTNNQIKTFLSVDDKSMIYYSDSKSNYINLSFLGEEYISLNNAKIKSNIVNKEYFNTSSFDDKYIKKFYLDEYVPIVEVNLILNNEDIDNIINYDLKDDYNVMLTFKNNAFTNEIIDMKIIINNLTNNNRKLITYKDGIINYSDDNNLNLKFTLSTKNDDFTLKIYQNDELHSVLTGTNNENSYKYLYQVIDKVYNISLVSSIDGNIYKYKIISNVPGERDVSYDEILITLKSIDNINLDNINLKNLKEYSKFTDEEKKNYNDALDDIIGDLRELINKYKDTI